MKSTFNISNSNVFINPVIYRLVELEIQPNYTSDKDLLLVDIVCTIKHYLDNNRTQKATLIQDKVVSLRIDDFTSVDKRSGNYATESTPEEFKQGELTFFMSQKIGSINEMLAFGVQRADLLGRFN
jgi:hypothetical protein